MQINMKVKIEIKIRCVSKPTIESKQIALLFSKPKIKWTKKNKNGNDLNREEIIVQKMSSEESQKLQTSHQRNIICSV